MNNEAIGLVRSNTVPDCQLCTLCAKFCIVILLCCYSFAANAEEYPAVDCAIQPYRVVDLGSPVSGVIKEVLVDRSEYVEKGQPVALIEDRVEKATVKLAAARAKVDAQLETEKTNIEYDIKSQRRIDSLYSRKVIAIDNKDTADREAELSKLRLLQVQDLQAVRDRELERARELVEQKIIRSTINGFVVNRFKSQGEFVEDQPIVRIAQLNPLNVEAILPMKYFGLIEQGMDAEVYPEVVSSTLRSATVTVVDRIGDAASGTFGVRLEITNTDYKIPAGLKCEVKFLPTSELAMERAREKMRASRNTASAAMDDIYSDASADVDADQPAESTTDGSAILRNRGGRCYVYD